MFKKSNFINKYINYGRNKTIKFISWYDINAYNIVLFLFGY